ncbi:EGF1 [Scenedesmus sp. PABB004]|nr:EGF1 [Scenedesmus sp. PABB004]
MAGTRDKEERESSSSEEASSEASSDFGPRGGATLFGGVRTRLCWDDRLALNVRQTLTSRRNVEFRYKARLDTSSGAFAHSAQLQKAWHQGTPTLARIVAAERGIRLDGEPPIDAERFLPGGLGALLLRDWTLAPGVRYEAAGAAGAPGAAGGSASGASSASSGEQLKYTVQLRKQPQVLWRRGVWDSWLAAKARLELDAATQRAGVTGSVRVKALRFNVTDKQDLQLAAGADVVVGPDGARRVTPFLKLGENSWCVRLQNRRVAWSYELSGSAAGSGNGGSGGSSSSGCSGGSPRRAAGTAGTAAAGEEEEDASPPPALGWALAFRDRGLEAAYWRACAERVLAVDRAVLALNAVVLLSVASGPAAERGELALRAVSLALLVAQGAALAAAGGAHYAHARPGLVVTQRLWHAALRLQHLRPSAGAAAAAAAPALQQGPGHAFLDCVLIGSGLLPAWAWAAAYQAPFATAPALQLATLLAVLLADAPRVLRQLGAPALQAHVAGAYTACASAAAAALLPLAPAAAAPAPHACPAAPEVPLLLWLAVFGAVAAPTYVSYHVERTSKVWFWLRALAAQPHVPEPTARQAQEALRSPPPPPPPPPPPTAAPAGSLQAACVAALARALLRDGPSSVLVQRLSPDLLELLLDEVISLERLTLPLLQQLVAPWLHHLLLAGTPGVDDAWLPVVARARHLRSLDLSGATLVGVLLCARCAAPRRAGSTAAAAAHTPPPPAIPPRRAPPRPQLSDAGAGWLSWLRQLTELRMQHCAGITDAGLAHVAGLTALRTLDLRGCEGLTSAGLAALAQLHGLTALSLAQCPALEGAGLRHMTGLSQLRQLSLGWCRALGDVHADASNTIAPLACLTALTELVLAGTRACDAQLGGVLPCLVQLQVLDLSGCCLTAAGLPALQPLARSLRVLKLRGCEVGDGDGPAALASLTAVQVLDLSCSGLGNAGLLALAPLAALRELDLDMCPIGDEGCRVLRRFALLERLDLSDSAVGDAGVGCLARCGRLAWLSLCNTEVGDGCVAALTHLTGLTHLNLDARCVSDACLRLLAPLGPRLRELDLCGARVGAKGAALLAAAFTGLRRLELCGGYVNDRAAAELCKLGELRHLNVAQNRCLSDAGVRALAAGLGPVLEALNLGFTGVGDASVPALATMRALKVVVLSGAGVSESAASRLRRARPKLLVKSTARRASRGTRTTAQAERGGALPAARRAARAAAMGSWPPRPPARLVLLLAALLAVLLAPRPSPAGGRARGGAAAAARSWLPALQLLPGAAAAYVDTLMPAGPKNGAAGPAASYDPGANWAALAYTWADGDWAAPPQQKQWWLGRHPPDDALVSLYLRRDWADGAQPHAVPFYVSTGLPRAQVNVVLPQGAPQAARGSDPNAVLVDYDMFDPNIAGYASLSTSAHTFGSTICYASFSRFCDGANGTLLIPNDAVPAPPTATSLLTPPGELGWEWVEEAPAAPTSDHTCNLFLRDLVASGRELRWVWSARRCAVTLRWEPFELQPDTLGGTAVYPNTAPTDIAYGASGQAVVLTVLGTGTPPAPRPLDNTGSLPTPLWPLHSWYDYPFTSVTDIEGVYHNLAFVSTALPNGTTVSANGFMISDAGDTDVFQPGAYEPVDQGDHCIGPFDDGDVCTLGMTPAPPDAAAANATCARALPHGLPVLACRRGSQLLQVNRLANMTLSFKVPAAYADDSLHAADPRVPAPTGLLPRVPCNWATFDRRHGGRCAAPVVQYLAHDEAYHTAAARQAHGLPQYGGCLEGGVTRWLAAEAAAAAPGAADMWDARKAWFVPPMWPFEAWRAASDDDATNVAASLYEGILPRQAALNADQEALDRLFLFQEVFELPAGKGSAAGCTRFRLNSNHRFQGTNRCWTAPASLTPPSGTGWSLAELGSHALGVELTPCEAVPSERQCFQVQGSLATSARITHRGLCVGFAANAAAPGPRSYAYLVSLRPCDEGWTDWQATAAGYLKPPACAMFSAAGCALALYSVRVDATRSRLALFNTFTTGSKAAVLDELGYGSVFVVTQESAGARRGGGARRGRGRAQLGRSRRRRTLRAAWPSYLVLQKFWLDSFATNAVDARAHRRGTRFVPPGARQGLSTRGDGGNVGCGGALGAWDGAKADNCEYNVGVTVGGQRFPVDACSDAFLASDPGSGARVTPCWSGSAWLYAYANACDRAGAEGRLTPRAGADADKCAARVGGQYAAADDLWSAMASPRHDPCGWPFVECVADCSLPSDPARRGWSVNATDGLVRDGGGDVVGCVNATTCASDPRRMRDPSAANRIAAIDWRNLTLYSEQLDFSAFAGPDQAGQHVWYLNLNFNMLGGSLAALAGLPDIFPNLRHLGLAHCSAGRHAPEYAWQQSAPEFCVADGPGGTVTNGACFCPDDAWDNMTVVPSVGAALDAWARTGSLGATVVRGVRRMFSGTIPATWGAKADGSPAAWAQTLISVNLAGHTDLYGDLPAAWYNQTAFPKLSYLKLKGTNIKPDMSRLTWNNASCSAINWSSYSGAGSVSDWAASCDPATTCAACDWWPARSAPPWFYTPATTPLTCGAFMPGGGAFPCAAAGASWDNDPAKAATTAPDFARCCRFTPTCGLAAPGGGAYACAPGSVLSAAAVNATAPSDAACCVAFVPTCGAANATGAPFACPSVGVWTAINPAATTLDNATCCAFVPTCGVADPGGSPWACTVAGEGPDAMALASAPPSDAACCVPLSAASTRELCSLAINSTHAGLPRNCSTGVAGECCYTPTCGAVPTFNATAIISVAPFDCVAGYLANANQSTSTTVDHDTCCYQPTCGSYWTNGTAYDCAALNPGYATNGSAAGALAGALPRDTCCVSGRGGAAASRASARRLLPDVVLSQSVAPASGQLLIASTLNISATLANQGEWAAENITITLDLPAGLELASSSPAGCAATGQTVTCGLSAPLAVNANTTVLVTLRATSPGNKTVNTSVALLGAPDSNVANNVQLVAAITVGRTCAQYNSDGSAYDCTASDAWWLFVAAAANNTSPSQATCCVELFPDLALNQSLVPADGQILIADTAAFNISVVNQGTWEAANVTTTQTLPAAGLAFVAPAPAGCSISGRVLTCGPVASLAAGGSASYAVVVKGTSSGSFSANTSVAAAGQPDSNAANNVQLAAAITVGRTCAQCNSDGSQFNCNNMWAFNTTAAGNTSPDNPTCCYELFPDLVISQTTAPASGEVLISDTVSFTTSIVNHGDWEAVNTNLTHSLPASLAFVAPAPAGCSISGQDLTCGPIATLAAAGGSTSFTFAVSTSAAGSFAVNTTLDVDRDSNLTTNGPLHTAVTVGRTCAQYNSDGSAYDCTASDAWWLFVAAAANNTSPSQATCCVELFPDLALNQSLVPADGQILIADTAAFNISVVNQGTWEAANVTTTQTLPAAGLAFVAPAPAGCSISGHVLTCGPVASLAAGGSASYAVVVKGTSSGSFSANTSVAAAGQPDSNAANNVQLAAAITVGRTCAQCNSDGSQFNCNNMWAFNTTAAGNTSPDNPTCCYELFPDLVISQTTAPASGEVLISDTVSFTTSIVNHGDWEAVNTNLTHSLPASLAFVAPAPAGCSISGQDLTCGPIATLAAAGGSTSFTFAVSTSAAGSFAVNTTLDVDRDSNLTTNGPLHTAVTVGRTCAQYNSDGSAYDCTASDAWWLFVAAAANNTSPSQATCCVELFPDLALNQSLVPADGQILIADTAAFNISVVNQGTWEAANVTTTQTLPAAGLAFVAPAPAGCSISGHVLTCGPVASLAAGGSASYAVVVKGTSSGSFSANTSVAAAGQPDSNAANNVQLAAAITVGRTCAQYNSDGSALQCPTWYQYNPQGASPSPDQAACCTYIPHCSAALENGTAFQCDPGFVLDAARANVTSLSNAACCVDFDACAASPCNATSNALPGVCLDRVPPFTDHACVCAQGFSWNQSALECTDDCVGVPDWCNGDHGNGTCAAGVCGCAAAWHGERCQYDVDGCTSAPCDGAAHAINGSCADAVAPSVGYACACAAGHSWDSGTAACKDDCTLTPNYCYGHASACAGGVCSCTAGWEGQTCDADIDGCAAAPCANVSHATSACVDAPAPATGHACGCVPHYAWDAAAQRCAFEPTCGFAAPNGTAFACPPGYAPAPSAANATSPSLAACCVFVPTCAFYADAPHAAFPCAPGYELDPGAAAEANTSAAACCRVRAPLLGVCEAPASELAPVLYAPRGAAAAVVPVLVVFPSPESRKLYCPEGPTLGGGAGNACSLRLLSLPMFAPGGSGAAAGGAGASNDATASGAGDGSVVLLPGLPCLAVAGGMCELAATLPGEGRWSVSLLPAVPNATWCAAQVALQPVVTEVRPTPATGGPAAPAAPAAPPPHARACARAHLCPPQVVLDSLPPVLLSMAVTLRPTVDAPAFQLLLTFSEPVHWVADEVETTTTTAGGANASAAAPDAGALDAGGSAQQLAAFSSSRIWLTNAALLNMTAAPDSLAATPDGAATGAATAYVMWLRSWPGTTAAVEVLGAAYQDLAGSRGVQDKRLAVSVPGSGLLQRAADMGSSATAVSAAASALGAAASVASGGTAGGTTSLLRSVGHTQFLAMSVSLAVPWLPAEYVRLCSGLDWSNLVKPAERVVQLTSNATAYIKQQLPSSPAARRHLMAAAGGDAARARHRHGRALLGDAPDARSVDSWLAANAAGGGYAASNGSGSAGTGVLVLGGDGSGAAPHGNGSAGAGAPVVLAGDVRQPKPASLHELRMSVLTLVVAVAAATLLQGAALGAWRLLRLSPDSLPTLLRSPKPQLLAHTLLMVPVVYGAAKLAAAGGASAAAAADAGAGVAVVALLPLPVFAFWAYVLWEWRAERAGARRPPPRSRSSILRTYERPATGGGGAAPPPAGQQRAQATLALLGEPADNPTLVLRDRHTGEDELSEAVEDPPGSGGGSDSDGERECAPRRRSGRAEQAPRPWRGADSGGGGGAAGPAPVLGARSGALRAAAISFLPTSGDERDDALAAVQRLSRSPRSATGAARSPRAPALQRAESLPGEAAADDGAGGGARSRPASSERRPDGAGPPRHSRGGPQPLDEARELPRDVRGPPVAHSGSSDSDEEREWRAERGTAAGGWGELASASGVALQGPSDGGAAAPGAGLARQQTWMSGGSPPPPPPPPPGAGAAAAAGDAAWLDRFGHLVDDLVGDERPGALARLRPAVLAFYVASAAQRLGTALFFGAFHFAAASDAQLGALLALHAAFLAYLLAARPLASGLLLAADVAAYGAELVILVAALLLRARPGSAALLSVLVACYFVDVCVMLAPELLRAALAAAAWLRTRRAARRARAAAAAAAARGDGAGGANAGEGDGVGVVAVVGVAGAARAKGGAALAAAPRASDARAAAGAAAAAAAALQLAASRSGDPAAPDADYCRPRGSAPQAQVHRPARSRPTSPSRTHTAMAKLALFVLAALVAAAVQTGATAPATKVTTTTKTVVAAKPTGVKAAGAEKAVFVSAPTTTVASTPLATSVTSPGANVDVVKTPAGPVTSVQTIAGVDVLNGPRGTVVSGIPFVGTIRLRPRHVAPARRSPPLLSAMADWKGRLAVLGGAAAIAVAVEAARLLWLRAQLSFGPVLVKRWAGETAVVTGGSEGVGKAVAAELARAGLNVLLVSRSQCKLDAAAADIRAAHPGVQVTTHAADLTAPGACDALLARLDAEGTRVAVLVANAGGGISGPRCYWDYAAGDEAYVAALNGGACYALVRGLLPGMLSARRGAVVAVSSLMHRWGAFAVPYGAEKAKINAMMAALDAELRLVGADGVTAQSLVLGAVDTPGVRALMARSSEASGGGGAGSGRLPGAPSAEAVAAAMVRAIGRGPPVITPYWRHAAQEWLLLDAWWPPALQRAVSRALSRRFRAIWEAGGAHAPAHGRRAPGRRRLPGDPSDPMETSLHYDPKQRHLSFLLKEGVTADPNVAMRFRGRLNTTTGGFEYHATAQKLFTSGPAIKESLTQPLRLGVGLGVSSGHADEPFLTATASKKLSLLEGEHTQLSAKARVELDPRSSRMVRSGHVAVSRRLLDFTAHQDLQLTVGLDLDWPRPAKAASGAARSGQLNADLHLSLRENNWGAHYRRGVWSLTYDL